MVSNVVGVPYDKVRIGMPVTAGIPARGRRSWSCRSSGGGGGLTWTSRPREEQAAARDLAAQIFGDLSTHERLAAAGTGRTRSCGRRCARPGCRPPSRRSGCSGSCCCWRSRGRTTAQVPFAATCVVRAAGDRRARYGRAAGAAAARRCGTARRSPPGRSRHAAATGRRRRARLSGTRAASCRGCGTPLPVLVPDARPGAVARTDRATPECGGDAVETTAPWSAARLALDRAPGERARSDAARTHGRRPGGGRVTGTAACWSRAGRAPYGVRGAAGRGVRRARWPGRSTTPRHREQFGRPLSTNQGVLLRAADAYMDTEAIRVTAYEAAWRHDEGLPPRPQALTAAWWASEAGRRSCTPGSICTAGPAPTSTTPCTGTSCGAASSTPTSAAAREVLDELGELLGEGAGNRDGAHTGQGARRASRRRAPAADHPPHPHPDRRRAPSPPATTRTCTTTPSSHRRRAPRTSS